MLRTKNIRIAKLPKTIELASLFKIEFIPTIDIDMLKARRPDISRVV